MNTDWTLRIAEAQLAEANMARIEAIIFWAIVFAFAALAGAFAISSPPNGGAAQDH